MKRGDDEVVDRIHAAKRAAFQAESKVIAARRTDVTEAERIRFYSLAEAELRDAIRLLTAARIECGERRDAIRVPVLPGKLATG